MELIDELSWDYLYTIWKWILIEIFSTKLNGQLLQFYMMPLQWAIPFLPLLFYLLEETIIINPNALICSLWLLACVLGPFAY
ncbi:hypothetical protein ES319_D09G015800v1 [Gossypium barbadense]|uniref:Uncharacterized protein n=3 Tax=Gossypium TaxID=3633 RepID=A0A5J5PXK6_GOSBA|nr:hypothetical protein ES319_D09G015800v1 [Gossypium barbadense]TYG52325.1 hypothetical protein ES288_D09G017800v1 [Gossypium darwinii]TYH52304.1 hypothetical protein ES332_D09G017500v1 [Gossypium tomentosum]